MWVTPRARAEEPRSCWRRVLIAQIFISRFPLQIKHLHECYGSVTGIIGRFGQ